MHYTLKTLLADAMGFDVVQTNNQQEFINSTLPKLNYSNLILENCVSIVPHSILFDVGIKDYPIEVSSHSQFEKIFFKSLNSSVPFDLFGASFWLLTRYEEYLSFKSDKFNRFNYKSSLAYQYDFIRIPLINLWLEAFKSILNIRYPNLTFRENKYKFISTLDIDNAFKYNNKGFVRSVAGYLSDILKRDYSSFKTRLSVIIGIKKDPFDCYDFLINLHKTKQVEAIYFFLLGDYGPNDKNQAASHLTFQALIKTIADYSKLGIHPSFGSTNKINQLKIEVSRLSNIIHRPITISRQHYSILKFPETYLNLLQAGIEQDFSMGYTNLNGFRASYCLPYKWYNLKDESQTLLIINPFCIAENTLLYYCLNENKTFIELDLPLINEVKKYKGQLISIFHNDTFNEEMKKKYVEFITCAVD